MFTATSAPDTPLPVAALSMGLTSASEEVA